MKTVACPACKSVNSADEESCGKCGAPLAAAKLEQSIAELRALNERTRHLVDKPKAAFNSINGFGTTLLDYRPRGDGTWEAVRWVIAMAIPLVPLGAYVIEPHQQEHTYGRQTSTFSIVDRVPLAAQRIVRTYLLVVIGLAPLVLGWMNSRWVNHTLGGGKAFFAMLATFAWAVYIILVRIKNDGPAYKAKPAATG
jgi:hypothetical protein